MKLTNIQGLRGAAALAVVLFHICLLEYRTYGHPSMFTSFFKNGWAGVDLFFVLSGFVMVKVTQGKFNSVRNAIEFLYDRILRVFPLYWVLSAFVLMLLAMKPALFHSMGHPSLARSLFLLPQLNQNPFLGQAWTLVFEMYFYYMFAALISVRETWLPYALCAWAGLLTAANLLALKEFTSAWTNLVASPLTLEFIIGCVVAKIVYSGFTKYARATGLAALISIVIAAASVGVHPEEHVAPWMRVFVFGIPCGLLTYALAVLEQDGTLRLPRWLAKVGDFSYSLYLVHMIPIGALSHVLPKQLAIARIMAAPIMLSVTVTTGAACYYFLERPFMRLVKEQKKKIFRETREPQLATPAGQVAY